MSKLQGAPLNILVVDDEVNIRKTLSYCLAAEGHTVIAVSNPADAAYEARMRFFDMAFVDLKLGGEDAEAVTGYSWPGNVRELRNTVERAVILGSGREIGKGDLPDDVAPVAGTPALGDPVPVSVIEELPYQESHCQYILAPGGGRCPGRGPGDAVAQEKILRHLTNKDRS